MIRRVRHCIALILFAAVTAMLGFGADGASLDALTAAGARLWEGCSQYVRLGKAPLRSTIDPGAALRRLVADFSSAGRYDEFRYLIEYVERSVASGRLVIGSVDDVPPLPGFWPARVGAAKRAIVVNADELASLSQDDAVYRSSFLRAAAALYYADASPAVPGVHSGRNAAAELVAMMSGLYVESIYLLEVLRLAEPEGTAIDYIDLLLGSAVYDNLRGAASALFRVDLDYAYDAVNAATKAASARGLADYLERAARELVELEAIISTASLRASPGREDLEPAGRARAALIALPWAAREAAQGSYGSDSSVRRALAGLVEALSSMASAYAPLDPLAMEETRRFLNDLRFRAPNPLAPVVGEPLPDYVEPVGPSGPPAFPGSAEERWYRLCLYDNPYEPVGELPIDFEAAMLGAAYRFSYGSEGGLLAIEHFIYGRLRPSDLLQWAARIRTGRDATGAWSVWESSYGYPMMNEAGYATRRESRTRNGLSLSFYATDGRRVPDCSNTYIVGIEPRNGGYDLSYRTADGRLWSGYYGYALDSRRIAQGGEETRSHFDELGRPVVTLSLGFHRSVSVKERRGGALVVDMAFFDEAGAPAITFEGYYRQRVRLDEEGRTYELLDADGEPMTSCLGWAAERIDWDRGLPVRLAFSAPDGGAVISMEGFHEARYELSPDGSIVGLSFYGTEGEPRSSYEGYHRREGEYDDKGALIGVEYFAADGSPSSDRSGASRIRWYLGADGSVESVRVWDAHGALIAGEPSRAL